MTTVADELARLRLLLSWNPAVGAEAEPILDRISVLLDEAGKAATLAERERVRRLMSRPALNAMRSVPDGEIRQGCVVLDGGKVREELRRAYLAVINGEEAT